MVLMVPLNLALSYPKLSKAYYGFVNIISQNHKKTVFALETTVFIQIMAAIHEGIQSSDTTLISLFANTVDRIAAYYFSNTGKEKV